MPDVVKREILIRDEEGRYVGDYPLDVSDLDHANVQAPLYLEVLETHRDGHKNAVQTVKLDPWGLRVAP